MRVLGICHDVLICSAAIVEDGQVLSAMPEERLDRVKQSRVFPALAVQRCLDETGLTMRDIDEVAVAWNPSIELETVPAGYLGSRRSRVEHLMQVPARLMQTAQGPASRALSITDAFADAPRVTFVNHYDAHIGASYFLSPYNEAALIVMDGRGEKHTGLLAVARGVEIETITEIFYPNSLGLFYGAITQYLGFKPDSDEWKVMALAAFAEPDNELFGDLAEMVTVADDGTIELALEYFEFYNQTDQRQFSDKFVRLFGPPRHPREPIRPEHERLAAAAQQLFEVTVAKVLGALHRQTGLDRVALSGGCFMNSVFNGKATDLTPFKDCFVSSCPDDSGTSVGAALYLEAVREGRKAPTAPRHNYWGPSYSDEECLATAKRCRLPNTDTVSDPTTSAARDLAEGKIVGWFQGAMEFGQRALGNRSILLDPRRPDGKDVVNAAVKYRESFRPFAPAILAEHVAEYFECDPGTRVPYMERVLPFHKQVTDTVPAVVHVDGTGRLQTVAREDNARFYALIEHFAARTGVPLVLNTSFNLNGEPIVCSPDDAIRTFYSCALDVLYLGNVRIAK